LSSSQQTNPVWWIGDPLWYNVKKQVLSFLWFKILLPIILIDVLVCFYREKSAQLAFGQVFLKS
jgi:hypothetical protein